MDIITGRRADGEHEQHRAFLEEPLHGVVEDPPHGGMVFAHHPFHAVHRADHVRFVDHIRAAHAHEQVLGVVGHADHLVGERPARWRGSDRNQGPSPAG